MRIPEELQHIIDTTPALDQCYLVGGCVRDAILGLPVSDFDIEVYNTDFDTLQTQLSRHGKASLVGKSFGTVKLRTREGEVLDFSLPRRDSKSGPGHRGFTVELDPSLTLEEATSRRDFTINAILFDPREKRIIDPHNGRMDLENRILRHVGPAFVDDPLRVLRGMQFAARFDLTAAPETIQLCQSILHTYSELPVERVWGEWFKWAIQSTRPSSGLRFIQETGWWTHYPILPQMAQTPQDPEWHPEGDAWTHTVLVCDAMAEYREWKEATPDLRAILMLAALTHDFGKPSTTAEHVLGGKKRITSRAHDLEGVPIADDFLRSIGCPGNVREGVAPLVAEHIRGRDARNRRSVRRLAHRLAPVTIEDLCLVMMADMAGRPPLPKDPPEWIHQLRQAAEAVGVDDSPPRPIILGRHLIDRGIAPGPAMGPILAQAFEAQLDGAFTTLEEALPWLDRNMENLRSK